MGHLNNINLKYLYIQIVIIYAIKSFSYCNIIQNEKKKERSSIILSYLNLVWDITSTLYYISIQR